MPPPLFQPALTTLTGGCFCSAIRYTIIIPPATDRPAVPDALPTPILSSLDSHTTTDLQTSRTRQPQLAPTTYPILELDHCSSCRRVCGSLVQCWLVVPLSWAAFTLAPRSANVAVTGSDFASQTSDSGPQDVSVPAADVVRPDAELVRRTYVGHYSSNGASQRVFCTRCGTPLTFFYSGDVVGESGVEADDVFDIAAGTLDDGSLALIGPGTEADGEEGGGIGVQRHSHWDSGVPWVREAMYGGLRRVRHPGGLPLEIVEEDKWMFEGEDRQPV